MINIDRTKLKIAKYWSFQLYNVLFAIYITDELYNFDIVGKVKLWHIDIMDNICKK